MATYTKVKLSGANARNNPIYFAYSTGTIVHETGISGSVLDEVWLWVTNGESGAVTIMVRVGNPSVGSTANFQQEIPGMTTLMISGGSLLLSGDGTDANMVQVLDSTTTGNSLYVYGYVNRITP